MKMHQDRMSVWASHSDGYYTDSVHLSGLSAGNTYEYDACGAVGVGEATCGWRPISEQDKCMSIRSPQ